MIILLNGESKFICPQEQVEKLCQAVDAKEEGVEDDDLIKAQAKAGSLETSQVLTYHMNMLYCLFAGSWLIHRCSMCV